MRHGMKKITYIQKYSIRGGQDERSGEETKRRAIKVKGENPEQDCGTGFSTRFPPATNSVCS